MKIVEVCSGIGGLSRAAEAAGHTIVAHVEREPFCCAVLHKHWPNIPILNDLYDVRGDEYERPDMLMGGIPCQPFSVAGKKLAERDPRHLWPEMYRLVNINQPEWVVIENVRGFIINGGFELVASDLESAGYEVEATLLSAYLSGSPQQRERVFIVAHTQLFHHHWEAALAFGYDTLWHEYERAMEESQNTDAHLSRNSVVQHSTSTGERSHEYGLAGDVTRLSGGVLAHRFPAGFGQAQYPWEPPRTIDRKLVNETLDNKRLKALGNAVVAQQAFPIFSAINYIVAQEEKEIPLFA